MKKAASCLIFLCFLATSIVGPCPLVFSSAYAIEGTGNIAQDFVLPAPGVMVHLSPPLNPPILKGIKVYPDNPFRFDFILDKGNGLSGNVQLKDISTKLIKYFLASLTIPEKDLWVNLSPYENNRIIPPSFGLTEMGRDLLAEDYMLKQITASLIYPEGEIGRKFWQRIYAEAVRKFGTTNIPVNTFNKVWIVPQKAVVYENIKSGTAYVVESRLKVMLEEDYLSLSKHQGPNLARAYNNTHALGNQIIREIVLPELAREVNEDKNFAGLRQVYNSLILATWYKMKVKNSILALTYEGQNKVSGINIHDSNEKERIYQLYLKAFKKGVYNYIKEDPDPLTSQPIPKKYFSGGMLLSNKAMAVAMDVLDRAPKRSLAVRKDEDVLIQLRLNPAAPVTEKRSFNSAMSAEEVEQIMRDMEPAFERISQNVTGSNLSFLQTPHFSRMHLEGGPNATLRDHLKLMYYYLTHSDDDSLFQGVPRQAQAYIQENFRRDPIMMEAFVLLHDIAKEDTVTTDVEGNHSFPGHEEISERRIIDEHIHYRGLSERDFKILKIVIRYHKYVMFDNPYLVEFLRSEFKDFSDAEFGQIYGLMVATTALDLLASYNNFPGTQKQEMLTRLLSLWDEYKIRLAAPHPALTSVKAVGIFPGLGNIDSYRNLGSALWDTGIPEIRHIYTEAAIGLNFFNRPGGVPLPQKLFMTDANLPEDYLDKRGFLSAAYVVHNVALNAYLKEQAKRAGIDLKFEAYTGESMGILAAAIASGSLSIRDGAKLARYLHVNHITVSQRTTKEEVFIYRLTGPHPRIAHAVTALNESFPEQTERFKNISSHQGVETIQLYVAQSVSGQVSDFLKEHFPELQSARTPFHLPIMAHSRVLIPARDEELEFIKNNGIVFHDPKPNIISNDGTGILTTGEQVEGHLLGLSTTLMESAESVHLADEKGAAVIVGIGLGVKIRELVQANHSKTPFMDFTGKDPEEFARNAAELNISRRSEAMLVSGAELESVTRAISEQGPYQALVTDIEGTLIPEGAIETEFELSQPVQDEFKRVKQKGIPMMWATGRTDTPFVDFVLKILREKDLGVSVLSFGNGEVGVEVSSGKILWDYRLPEEQMITINRSIRQKALQRGIVLEDSDPKGYYFSASPSTDQNAWGSFLEGLGRDLAAQDLSIGRSRRKFNIAYFFRPHINKALAVTEFNKYLGLSIPFRKILRVGDNYNDGELLKDGGVYVGTQKTLMERAAFFFPGMHLLGGNAEGFVQAIKAAFADNAMGGIDLTARRMHVEIQNQGNGIQFHMDPAMLHQLQISPGFDLDIINMRPITDIKGFLEGLKVT